MAEAIDAYGLVLQNYRNSPLVPDAHRKRGQAHAQNGQLDKAREMWEAVIKLFPESEGARLAQQDLQRINRTLPPRSPDAAGVTCAVTPVRDPDRVEASLL